MCDISGCFQRWTPLPLVILQCEISTLPLYVFLHPPRKVSALEIFLLLDFYFIVVQHNIGRKVEWTNICFATIRGLVVNYQFCSAIWHLTVIAKILVMKSFFRQWPQHSLSLYSVNTVIFQCEWVLFILMKAVFFYWDSRTPSGGDVMMSPEQCVFGYPIGLLAGEEDNDEVFSPWVVLLCCVVLVVL